MWTLHGRSGLGVRPDSSRARKGSNTSSQYSLTRSTCQHPPHAQHGRRAGGRGAALTSCSGIPRRRHTSCASRLSASPAHSPVSSRWGHGDGRQAPTGAAGQGGGAHLVPRPDVQPDHTVPLLDQQLRGDRRVDATRDADSHQRRRLRASSRERAAAPCRSARHRGRHRRRKDRAAQSSPEPPHRRLGAAVGSELRRSRRAGMGSGAAGDLVDVRQHHQQ